VVAPGGVLRLVPMGVLHDGEKFAIERFAVSVVSGMSMTNMSPRPGRKIEALVAGISDPGPVVTKLDQAMMAAVADAGDGAADTRGLAGTRQTRAVRSAREVRNGAEAPTAGAASLEELRKRFALPGVKEEVDALRLILAGTNILNKDFTVGHFSEEAESGRYRIVHIATHGFFGGNAESSFIMAYDDLLTINGLQALLKSESFEKNPIELLSLSACQTAQGNDRAPLGISGAAIKARAKSVVGTLWPVDDDAAKSLMTSLYTRMTRDGLSKTAALREAQLELLRTNRSQAPFFWAPFVLIGNWL
jgi:CHAT domain-containing protein